MSSDGSVPVSVAVMMGSGMDALRLAPVAEALRRTIPLAPFVMATDVARGALRPFGVTTDVVVEVPPLAPHHVTSPIVAGVREVLARVRPAWVLVAGDHATAFATAVAAYYERIPVAHLACGRSAPPFGELNRRMVDHLAERFFVPTERAAAALLAEGVAPRRVCLTGDPLVDGMLFLRGRYAAEGRLAARPACRIVLVAARGRESLDAPFRELCLALRRIVGERPDVQIVYPLHRDEDAGTASVLLGDQDRVSLLAPFGSASLAAWLDRAHLVITDSDDVRVAAAALGKPMVVLGDAGARPEELATEGARVAVGGSDDIYDETATLLDDQVAYVSMTNAGHPYGDGSAALRIARALADAIGAAPMERHA